MRVPFFSILLTACLFQLFPGNPDDGLQFTFKNRSISLNAPARQGAAGEGVTGAKGVYFPRGRFAKARLDTLSSWFDPDADYIEIIRQDDPLAPTVGVALGFEFDEENGDYPYTPARAVMQLKDFGWGGVEFSARDTMNYTGVSNEVSDDLMIEIDGFANDTIWGRFSGVLVSGAGSMAGIEDGRFRVKIYRVR